MELQTNLATGSQCRMSACQDGRETSYCPPVFVVSPQVQQQRELLPCPWTTFLPGSEKTVGASTHIQNKSGRLPLSLTTTEGIEGDNKLFLGVTLRLEAALKCVPFCSRSGEGELSTTNARGTCKVASTLQSACKLGGLRVTCKQTGISFSECLIFQSR